MTSPTAIVAWKTRRRLAAPRSEAEADVDKRTEPSTAVSNEPPSTVAASRQRANAHRGESRGHAAAACSAGARGASPSTRPWEHRGAARAPRAEDMIIAEGGGVVRMPARPHRSLRRWCVGAGVGAGGETALTQASTAASQLSAAVRRRWYRGGRRDSAHCSAVVRRSNRPPRPHPSAASERTN